MTFNKYTLLRILLYGILIAFITFYIMPLYVMLTTSFKDLQEIRAGSLLSLPIHPSLDAWTKAWSMACAGIQCEGIRPYFWNSIQMTIPAITISILIGAFNGYVLAQWRFYGSNVLFGLLLFGCFIPFQAVLIPMAQLLGIMNLAGSVKGLVLIHVVYGISFTTLFYRNFFVSVSPEIIRAAKIDGAGFFRIFFLIMLPISIPVTVVSVIWQFTQVWNDFLFGVSFSQAGSQPVTVALQNIIQSSTGVKEYNVDMAAAILAALPTIIVYMVAGKYFIRGITAGSVKG